MGSSSPPPPSSKETVSWRSGGGRHSIKKGLQWRHQLFFTWNIYVNAVNQQSCVILYNFDALFWRRATEIQRGGVSSKRRQFLMGWRGRGGGRESFFRGLRVRLMSKLSVLLLIIGVSKQKIIVFIDVGWVLFCTACTIVYVKCYHPLVNKFLVICLLLCYTIYYGIQCNVVMFWQAFL